MFMKNRPFWINKIQQAWEKRSIIWLAGVRRAGKTTLTKMIPDAIYINLDLPSENRRIDDPEFFYNSLAKKSIIIFDEIHRFRDPGLLLKIAADKYPDLKIIATGSSTLTAISKFRDTLTGRKISINLTPVTWLECQEEFAINDFDKRLLFGGLPEPLLSSNKESYFFAEWIDSFYSRDIQELFGIRNRQGFMKLFNLLMLQSGGQLEYSQLSKLSALSRQTVVSHIESMEVTRAIHLIPPYYAGGKREILKRPKCYCFDTGFVTFVKGWQTIRDDDRGILWEHLVLDMLLSMFPEDKIYYWKDKSDREIDFVIKRVDNKLDAIECKINPDNLTIKNLKAFRSLYPEGKNFCISPYIKQPYQQIKEGFIIDYFSGFTS
jgi:uncharacterized protein